MPEVSMVSPSDISALVGIYVAFNILSFKLPLHTMLSSVLFRFAVTELDESIIVCTLAVLSVTDIIYPY